MKYEVSVNQNPRDNLADIMECLNALEIFALYEFSVISAHNILLEERNFVSGHRLKEPTYSDVTL